VDNFLRTDLSGADAERVAVLRYGPVPGISVPLSWVTRYCSRLSLAMTFGSLVNLRIRE
jgi:hypothetical protein